MNKWWKSDFIWLQEQTGFNDSCKPGFPRLKFYQLVNRRLKWRRVTKKGRRNILWLTLLEHLPLR